jgi:hypothetical protein
VVFVFWKALLYKFEVEKSGVGADLVDKFQLVVEEKEQELLEENNI